MNTFSLQILTPARRYPAQPVTLLDVPAETGRLTILAGHAPLICALKAGPLLLVDARQRRETWHTAPGVLQVRENQATLIVEGVQPPESNGPGPQTSHVA